MSSSSPQRIENQEQAAAAIGVSYRTLQRWEKENWFPKVGRTSAGYDVDAVRRAAIIAGRLKDPNFPTTEDDDADKAQKIKLAREAEGLKRDKVRREHDELKLRTAQGDLIPRHGVEQSFADLLTGIADWCEQLPDLYVSMLAIPKRHHKACRNLLRELIEQKQRDLRDELEAKALDRDKDPRPNE